MGGEINMETETIIKHTITRNEVVEAIKIYISKKAGGKAVHNVEIRIGNDEDGAVITGASAIEVTLKDINAQLKSNKPKRYKENSGV
jgi:translation initiation factor 1 (eIF-1/SUI1)